MSTTDRESDLLTLALGVVADVTPELVRARRDDTITVDTKSSDTDLVTQMDQWSENQLVDRLLAARPDDGILGEEGTSRDGTSGVRWIIDPIDGTTNYLYDLPGYSVSVAAEIDGEMAVGIVADPVRNETYTALRGRGAFRNGAPVAVAEPPDLRSALVGSGFSYDGDRRRGQARVLESLLPRIRDLRRNGGAAVDLASVASGRLDAFFEFGLSPWDIAAGGLIAIEAGAVLTDLDGAPSWTGTVVCAAPRTHEWLLAALTDAGAIVEYGTGESAG